MKPPSYMPKEVTTTGRMDTGHLHIRNRPMFTQALSALRDGEVEVVEWASADLGVYIPDPQEVAA